MRRLADFRPLGHDSPGWQAARSVSYQKQTCVNHQPLEVRRNNAMTPNPSKPATTRFVTLSTYAANRPVEGAVVTLLDSTHEARGLRLIPTYSRALPRHSIHELIATDETDKGPGDMANRIAYLAFFEVTRGGCVIAGETLFVDGRPVGTVLGFDETHEPNHINIIIGVNERRSGAALKLAPGSTIRFERT